MKLLQVTASSAKELAQPSTGYSFTEAKTIRQSLRMRVVDPLREPAWDHIVALHRDADCFHTSAWARVLRQTYKHQPFYLHFSCGSRLAALVPLMEVRSPFTGRRGVCLPFSDECEPLIFDPDVVGAVRDELIRLAQQCQWKHLEIRGGKSLALSLTPFTRFYGHTLDLRSGIKELITRFASPVRRAIRKAERSEVTVVIVRNRAALIDFYRLHVRTRRRHGLPPQPASFFLNIYEHLIDRGLGFIVLAHQGRRPIAAAIFFRFGKNALYKYGASDKRFQELRANNLVMWQGIQFLASNGAEKLHFGRTEQQNEGLRRFKLSWNTQEETMDYFRFDPSGRQCSIPARSCDSGLHRKVFRRLPSTFNRLAGSLIYPHLD